MRSTDWLRLGAAMLLFVYGCAGRDSRPAPGAAEAEVAERSRLLTVAEAAKDVEKATSFWLPNALVHMEGTRALRGSAEIRDMYRNVFASVVSSRSESEDIAIASSGDLAWETGTNEATMQSSGGVVTSTHKYLTVWKRGSDGQWRIAAFSITSNPPK